MIATIDRKCQESARKGLKTRALMFRLAWKSCWQEMRNVECRMCRVEVKEC